MSTTNTSETDARSRWLGWTLLPLLGGPLLYVLTLPPLSLTVFTFRSHGGAYDRPDWLVAYGMPYEWLARNASLEGWLLVYGDWWASLFGIG